MAIMEQLRAHAGLGSISPFETDGTHQARCQANHLMGKEIKIIVIAAASQPHIYEMGFPAPFNIPSNPLPLKG